MPLDRPRNPVYQRYTTQCCVEKIAQTSTNRMSPNTWVRCVVCRLVGLDGATVECHVGVKTSLSGFAARLSLHFPHSPKRRIPAPGQNAKFAVLGERDPCSAHCSRCPKYDLLKLLFRMLLPFADHPLPLSFSSTTTYRQSTTNLAAPPNVLWLHIHSPHGLLDALNASPVRFNSLPRHIGLGTPRVGWKQIQAPSPRLLTASGLITQCQS